MIRTILSAICIATSTTALGQCAPGIPGAGNPGCIPPDVAGSPGRQYQPPQSTHHTLWESRWGAIAIDSNTGEAGTVTGRRSESEAKKDALRDCTSQGVKSCKIDLTYHDQCAAIAWGSGHYGAAGGPYESDAKKEAMRGCEVGASDCKIVYSDCSYAERVR
jgi:Domain of unknown function (DUF4189)